MLPIRSGKVHSLSVSLIPHIETSLLALALREMEEDALFYPSGSDVGIHIQFLDQMRKLFLSTIKQCFGK
jgi:hypothetical protein